MLTPRLDRRLLSGRMRAACTAAAVLVLLPAGALRATVQDAPTDLVLQVFDPTGAVLPGVAVELQGPDGVVHRGTTEGTGRVRLDGVAPGDYDVSATLPGFRTLRTPISMGVASDWRRSITLQVGEIEETINVTERRQPPGAASRAAVVEPPAVGGNIKVPKKLKHVSPDARPRCGTRGWRVSSCSRP
ncbi:MAG: carboxypeptidase-like regulatory domain-containing protein [Vicinamibacterales bacterium]